MRNRLAHFTLILLSLLTFLPLANASPLLIKDQSLPEAAFLSTTEPQSITLLSNGLAGLEKRLQWIESAKKSIDLEYYIFKADSAGSIIAQALLQSAKKGVKVRILIDGIPMASKVSGYHLHTLLQLGAELKVYNRISPSELTNHRNHRKLFIVDGEKAIVGGRNIAEEYFDLSPSFNFLDREVAIEGSLVQAMQKSYDTFWNLSKSSKNMLSQPEPPKLSDFGFKSTEDVAKQLSERRNAIARANYASYLSSVRRHQNLIGGANEFMSMTAAENSTLAKIRQRGARELNQSFQTVCSESYFFADSNAADPTLRVVYKLLRQVFQQTQKEIWIESPYFVMPESNDIIQSILDAKIPLHIFTNSLASSDTFLTAASFYPRIQGLMQKGAEIFLFRGKPPENREVDFLNNSKARWGLHAKTFVIDDSITIISSYNIDPRSKDLNSEMAFICRGNQDLANAVKEDMKSHGEAMAHLNLLGADQLSQQKYSETTLSQRFLYYLARPFIELLEDYL